MKTQTEKKGDEEDSMVEHGDIWTLEDGNKYVVASIVTMNDRKFVYLIQKTDYKNYIIGEYLGEDDLEEVDDPDLLETLIVKFNEDLKDKLPKIIEQYL